MLCCSACALFCCVLQPIAPHNCGRIPISDVKEEEFMADLISFLSHRRGRYIDRSKFPDAGELRLLLLLLWQDAVGLAKRMMSCRHAKS
jgi:hypothetical protein